MSQIGNEKSGLEMIGRLLGGVDGKAGRVAAKLGDGASQEFARLMASAQGRLDGARAMPNGERPLAMAANADNDRVLSPQLQSALSALGEEVVRLRQRLASDVSAQPNLGEASQGARAILEQVVEAVSPSGSRQATGQGQVGDAISGLREGLGRGGQAGAPSAQHLSAQGQSARAEGGESFDPARADSLKPGGAVDQPGEGTGREAVSRSISLERLANNETFANEVAELAEVLADWRQALDGGAPGQAEATADALRDRLAALRESMQDAGLGPADRAPGLIGQLQALQQLMVRAESGRAGEATGGRGAGEPRAWSEWSWRLGAGGQGASARAGSASAVAPLAPSGDTPDWSGGPVTAALGLAGREMPPQSSNERLAPMHWSSLGAAGGQSTDSAAEPLMASGGLAQAAAASASSLNAGSPAGGVFTGQSATPPPNPQMPAQLGQQIQWMVGKGQSRAQIELRPADLGPLRISIETQGDETRIALTATNATTQGLLEQQLPRLKEWLQESGLANSEVDVSLGQEGDFDQQLADADGDEPDGRGGFAGETAMSAAAGATDGEGSETEWVEGRGVLDLFA